MHNDPSKVSLRYILSQIIDTLWQGFPNCFAPCFSAKRLYHSRPIASFLLPSLSRLLGFLLLLCLFTLASWTPFLFSQFGKCCPKGKTRSLTSLYLSRGGTVSSWGNCWPHLIILLPLALPSMDYVLWVMKRDCRCICTSSTILKKGWIWIMWC